MSKWRSSYRWRKVRAEALERNGVCDVCGSTEKLEVHHVMDASYHPELRYEQDNLKVMCHKCHFTFFHILYKGSTRKKTIKKDYKRFKAIAKWYMKKGQQ